MLQTAESDVLGSPEIAIISMASTVMDEELHRTLEEMIFDTATEALGAVGLTASDIDGFVVSGNDEIDGRVISIMPAVGPVGGVGKDTTMVASSADHALVYGWLRIKAGQGAKVLVVGWAKPSESVDPDRAELAGAEPFLLRRIGMNDTIAAALQASVWAHRDGDLPNVPDAVAWPLSRTDLPARGDSVYAILLAADGEFAPGSELAWIVDAGWATDSYELGARDLGMLRSLDLAVAQIVKRSPHAGPASWSSIEVGGASEHVVREVAKSVCLRGGGVVNASGALKDRPTWGYVNGLGRMVQAAWSVNVDGADPVTSAGIGFNGFAGQGATVVVFSNVKGGAA